MTGHRVGAGASSSICYYCNNCCWQRQRWCMRRPPNSRCVTTMDFLWRLVLLLHLFLQGMPVVDGGPSVQGSSSSRALPVKPLPAMPKVSMPHIDSSELSAVVDQAAETVMRRLDAIEAALEQKGIRLSPGSPEWFAATSAAAKSDTANASRVALVAEEATRILAHSLSLSKEQVAFGLPTTDIRRSLLGGTKCPVAVDFPCQPRKYRAHSSYCNNVQNPRWGNANVRYLRYLAADYADGVSIPRQATEGGDLPSGRAVCVAVHRDVDRPHPAATVLLPVWAQFVAIDIAHTARVVGRNGARLRCCGVRFDEVHPECFPVAVSSRDPFYARHGVACLDYVRSAVGPRTGCTLGPREQMNQATSFLDASVIYGSSEEECRVLRTFQLGFLKTQQGGGHKSLPPPADASRDCRGHTSCFSAGDYRVNENVGVALMQTLWIREHNRLARLLHDVNPHWTDETLFQEARRIVAAEVQHITYSEFLPAVLGETLVERYGLRLRPSGHFTGYDINVNPGTANAVATAALRFYASAAPAAFYLYDRAGRKVGERPLSATFYDPADLHDPRRFEQLLAGLVRQRVQAEDEFVTEQLTGRLFAANSSAPGMDLVALTIQQGRDHGLPGYTRWREFCGLPAVQDFDGLQDVMTPETVERLRAAFSRVSDVDLFTGGVAEVPSKGAFVGPTFGCLLARQFDHTRRGDRFWFENDLPPSSFTKEQLTEIRKVTLARVLCDNADGLQTVQPRAMYAADPFLNAFMECRSDAFPSLNVKRWRTASTTGIHIPTDAIRDSVESGKRKVDELRTNEFLRFSEKVGLLDEKSPSGASAGLLRPKRQAVQISNSSLVLQFATQRFVSNFMQARLKDMETTMNSSVRLQDLMNVLSDVDVSEFVEIPSVFECDEQTLPCDHTSKFRTFTGWCNNLDRPNFGKTYSVFQRLVPPQYDDGLSTPRSRGATGAPLPSPRLVSTTCHPDVSDPHVRYTLMVMQLAQIVDHDLTLTPISTGFKGALLDCTSCNSAEMVHPDCLPIPVPMDDPYFPPVSLGDGLPRCLALMRSLPGQLTLGPRQQINQATAFLDASIVYGSDICVARGLRAFTGGRLNATVLPTHAKELLPENNANKECRTRSGVCFEAGDDRPSEQPGLGSMHTMFLREHNRIVGRLAQINPQWDDETLYQNGRRILSSIFQHIVFNELLPRVLGRGAAHRNGLDLLSDGYFDGYDPTCDPTVLNEFSTAAFRFGHSLIRPRIPRLDPFFRELDPLPLRHRFFNSEDLYRPGMIDELLRGLATASMETLDPFITSAVTNHLFEDRLSNFSGLDLISLNLQRAREHGVGTYALVRAACNLTRARRFDDLGRDMPATAVQRLRAVYAHPDDIDLFSGGMLETALHGGLVGPTFACVIGRQFGRLRRCDRFWYETSNPLVRFTEAQLAEIRKASLAKIICVNSETIDSIQHSILDQHDSFLNPRVPCQSLPSVDLDAWKERVVCTVGAITINIGSAERISPCVMCTCTKEGPLCQSLKVTDCKSLASKFSREAILRDHVCKVQCAFAFRALPEVDTADGLLGIGSP